MTRLTFDEWRASEGFSKDMERAHELLFSGSLPEQETISALNDWIAKFQPCLFGRIAAKLGLIDYCILSEADLGGSERLIRDKIRGRHLEWQRRGRNGDSSAFVILSLSRNLAEARPDDVVKEIARKLCSLYLLQDVVSDDIYLDTLELDIPGRDAGDGGGTLESTISVRKLTSDGGMMIVCQAE